MTTVVHVHKFYYKQWCSGKFLFRGAPPFLTLSSTALSPFIPLLSTLPSPFPGAKIVRVASCTSPSFFSPLFPFLPPFPCNYEKRLGECLSSPSRSWPPNIFQSILGIHLHFFDCLITKISWIYSPLKEHL